jgi:glutamate--cysteine ligase
MSHHLPQPDRAVPIHSVPELRAHVSGVCFKHGPPARIGLELEWLLHDPDDPDRYPDPEVLRQVLGSHAPRTLDPNSPAEQLPQNGLVTVEPGGQIEISSAPAASVAALVAAMTADVAYLSKLLEPSGFGLSDVAADPRRRPRRMLHTPRYNAMADRFDEIGPAGLVMMCSTAATQVCVDLGTSEQAPARWRAAHQVGPTLLGAFANSPRTAGDLANVASTRMSSWWLLDPVRTAPPASLEFGGYVERAMDTPVLARCSGEQNWRVDPPLTLREWLASGRPLTTADVDLHLSMLFPPVRPQGYLELRYLDAQPAWQWIVPLALLAALFADEDAVRLVNECTASGADRWRQATEIGLADPVLRSIAGELWSIAEPRLASLGLDDDTTTQVCRVARRRLVDGISPGADQLISEGSS